MSKVIVQVNMVIIAASLVALQLPLFFQSVAV
jgi:hypothetical protein